MREPALFKGGQAVRFLTSTLRHTSITQNTPIWAKNDREDVF